MKTFALASAVGLALVGTIAPVAAQYGGYDDGYRARPRYGDEYDRRDRGYEGRRSRDYDDERRYGGGFDERGYLRCNPDVRRAVQRGEFASGAEHFRLNGRRENRRFSC